MKIFSIFILSLLGITQLYDFECEALYKSELSVVGEGKINSYYIVLFPDSLYKVYYIDTLKNASPTRASKYYISNNEFYTKRHGAASFIKTGDFDKEENLFIYRKSLYLGRLPNDTIKFFFLNSKNK